MAEVPSPPPPFRKRSGFGTCPLAAFLSNDPSGGAESPGALSTLQRLLLLAGTIFIGVLLFFLFDLSDDAKSTDVIVIDALAGALFFGLLIFVPALPGGLAYLFLMRRIAQKVSGARLRALALLLSPIVLLHLFFLLETWYPLALALPFGAVVRLPKQNHLPLSSA